MLLFSTAAYAPLAADLAPLLPTATLGQIDREHFPDGERYLRLATDPAGHDVALVGGTVSDADTLEIYDLACALAKYGARRLTLVIPYFGYSTMERATRPGEVVVAKTRARLLSSIPAAPAGVRVLLLDLHAAGIPYYFEGGLTPVHVYGKPLVATAAQRITRESGADQNDFVLASTDAGRAKWVESLANDLGVSASFVFKRRLAGDSTKITAVSAQVENRVVIIYDDMIRTGGSLLQAARAYKDAGARSLAAVTTHGLFPTDALARLLDSALFSHIVCTDSHPRARELAQAEPRLQVLPTAPLFAAHLS
ncbi:MAG TPA: ribose-phosphate diphosphokinase [Tepidisphaeraceae bacterium]|nr:ribose-phosphate diphosphokinase [Tepidisphaeraceae bacterium]